MKQNKILENVISLSEIDLSQDQIAALNLFENFLEKDPSDGLSIFILSGYAGTGKSTLTSLLNKSLKGFKINLQLKRNRSEKSKKVQTMKALIKKKQLLNRVCLDLYV